MSRICKGALGQQSWSGRQREHQHVLTQEHSVAALSFVEEGQRISARAAGSVKTPMRRAKVSAMQRGWLFACSLFGPKKFWVTVSKKSVSHFQNVPAAWEAQRASGMARPHTRRSERASIPESIHCWQMGGLSDSGYFVED
jgi:hypothetical protein